MSNTSKAICAVSQQVDTLIRDLPEPTADDTPRTRNAWIRLLTLLCSTGTVISEHHDFDTNNADEVEADLTKVNDDKMEGNQNANGNERQGQEEDEETRQSSTCTFHHIPVFLSTFFLNKTLQPEQDEEQAENDILFLIPSLP
ncbi:hypothetical protein B0H10DRAFT_2220484 [Mycena sp. CBHHK59/15]|nr:hypothetical protein B0H10DRAFT_2220484 [Mycena sp. CBHHK59/15]